MRGAPAADGSLHDACLLAALAALSSLRLHKVSVDEAGRITTAAASENAAEAAAAGGNAAEAGSSQQGAPQQQRQQLELRSMPVSLTTGVFRERLLVDPTAEEEPFLEVAATVTVDEGGDLLGELEGPHCSTAGRPVEAASTWQRPRADGLFGLHVLLFCWAGLAALVSLCGTEVRSFPPHLFLCCRLLQGRRLGCLWQATGS
jgi:hypothetical protein